ncbi:MAG: transcriptional regulator [Gammaproteobacteria bacterium RIFCSPHIGHO2_12_FULL_37_14]|nr:MAG: transcriptional regulator [Gammaproteobacteria bacterium RIFCSPHIGHO2_12_FULL_37_14]
MSEQPISNTLLRLIKLHGDLSLSDLARETQIPQPTLHHILDGKTKKPRRQALEALANFFSISIPQLIGVAPLSTMMSETIKNTLKISTVPLIDWSLTRNWEREKCNLAKFDEIILEKQVDKNAFAIRMKDSTMEPLFHEKSLLIFDPSKKPKERDFVLVYISKNDAIIFNRLFIDGEKFYLKQEKTNGDAELIKINLKIDKIIATLIEARLQF